MVKAPPSGLSYSQFLDWVPDGIHAEWVDGDVIVMSPASREHQRLVRFLTVALSVYAEETEAGEVLPAPFQMRLEQGPSGREPDVLFVRNERLALLESGFLNGPADLVIEVICPESRGRDTVDKLDEYSRGGVEEYWIIDPFEKSIRIFHQGADGLEAGLTGNRLESRVLEGFWMESSWLWERPFPTIRSLMATWGWG